MRLRIGFRVSVILLFSAIYISSMILFHNFYNQKLQSINDAFANINFDEAFSELSFSGENDEEIARDVLSRYQESLVSIEATQREAQIYSVIYLFFLLLISIGLFILLFYYISNPLAELQKGTNRIQSGDFSVKLRERGFREMRELIASFNRMSLELKETQNKLLEAEKLAIWKEFSRILAHEIKNPLTPIQLSIQRLEEKFYNDEKKCLEIFPESVKIINQEIQNLYNLAKSFSNFAKNVEPERTIFNPLTVIQDIIAPYQTKYMIQVDGLKNINICFDQLHFYQIITNIIQNAIDASDPSDSIYISITKRIHNVHIQITDQGCGIAEDDIPKIFEPYFSKKKKGIGLGMALVKKLVEVNNAKINVVSKIDEGTKFDLIMEKCHEDIDH